ncbi:MAG TPA: hypothetical protein VMU26_23070 [Candidatus Polarisedimenticolia bacterium]|nr:hypothetical protein [Candidatus Polarisedimenticolia bacterium]
MFSCAQQRCSVSHRFSQLRRALSTSLFCFVLLVVPYSLFAQSNGISVGQPKVYDNQSLTIMLDQLSAQLDKIQAIDQQSLIKAFGMIQGSQQTDVTREFNATVSLTPKAAADTATAAANTGNSSKGDNSPSSTSSPAGSSNISALPELLPAPSYKPNYGENAVDLLSDQVDLTYQIFNLRMLLERSVSDRLKDGAPRRQAVVGFNITVDPPSNARDAAAYVEVTLTSDQGPLSLVATMPQEKTYNSTSLSSSSNAFGGSAVAKIISINYSQRKRSQTFFLYRDCDTLALERAPVGQAVTFGWVFRPVLGRRSVSPGMRQMFAVIALPETDLLGDSARETAKEKEKPGSGFPHIQVHAKTYWLHYDKGTATTLTHPGFWDWSSKSLPGSQSPVLADVIALPTKSIEISLHPQIREVTLFQTTNGNTVLQISGENFFTGTSVTIGDRTFAGPHDGLFLKSSQTMLLTANTDILSRSWRGVVNGRYGPAVPLYPAASKNGIVIAKSSLTPRGPNFTELELIIDNTENFPPKDLTVNDIKDFPTPVLLLNGAQISYRPMLQNTKDSKFCSGPTNHCLVATVTLPNSLLHSRDNRAGIIFPLLGDHWAAEDLIYDTNEVQVTRMTTGTTTTLLISRPGIAFNKNWNLILDKTYPLIDPPPAAAPEPAPEKEPKDLQKGNQRGNQKVTPPAVPLQFSTVVACKNAKIPNDLNDCYMLKIVADTKTLSNYQKFILVSDRGLPQILNMPAAATTKETAAPAKPATILPATVGLNEVITVTIAGTGLDAVKQVTFEGKPLTFWAVAARAKSSEADAASASSSDTTADAASDAAAPKTSQIQVLLSRDVTGKEGRQELLLQVDSKNMATIAVTVSPAPTPVKIPTK